jgi:acyl-ACP thioesterase
MQWYKDNNCGFILTNWDAKVNRLPKFSDKVKVCTWPTLFKGLICERYFEMQDENGQILAWANSKWVFMDLNKRRPVKPSAGIIESYGSIFPAGFSSDFNFPKTDGFDKTGTENFTVTRRDIDSNDHVNNVKYIEWVADCIPDDIYDNYNVCEMKAVYRKECKRGCGVIIETYINRTSSPEIINIAKSGNDMQTILFESYMKLELR